MPRRDSRPYGPSAKGGPASGGKKHITGIVQVTRKGTGYLPWPDDKEKEDIEIFPDTLAIKILAKHRHNVAVIADEFRTECVTTIAHEVVHNMLDPNDPRIWINQTVEQSQAYLPLAFGVICTIATIAKPDAAHQLARLALALASGGGTIAASINTHYRNTTGGKNRVYRNQIDERYARKIEDAVTQNPNLLQLGLETFNPQLRPEILDTINR